MECPLALCSGMFRASTKWHDTWQSLTVLPWFPFTAPHIHLSAGGVWAGLLCFKSLSKMDLVALGLCLLYQCHQGWVLLWKQAELLSLVPVHGSHRPSPGWGFWTCPSPPEMQNNLAALCCPSVQGMSACSHLDKAIWSLAEIFICTNVWLLRQLKKKSLRTDVHIIDHLISGVCCISNELGTHLFLMEPFSMLSESWFWDNRTKSSAVFLVLSLKKMLEKSCSALQETLTFHKQ